MTTVTVKLPEQLDNQLEAAAARKRTTKSAVIRELLEQGIRGDRKSSSRSCYDLAKDLCGSVKGVPRDLSNNKEYLKRFGQ